MALFSLLAPIYDFVPGWLLERQTAALLARLSPVDGKTILDLGGGTGRVARRLRKNGADAWLLDASLSMLRQARLSLPAGRVFHGDAASLPFPDGFFDLVLMVDSLHHFRQQKPALNESCRVLRTGGSLYILDFTPHSPLVRVLSRLERLLGERPVFLTPDGVQALLPAALTLTQAEHLSPREYLLQFQKFEAP